METQSLQQSKKGEQMKSKVLEIKNSEKILYLALGLFSDKDSLEAFF